MVKIAKKLMSSENEMCKKYFFRHFDELEAGQTVTIILHTIR